MPVPPLDRRRLRQQPLAARRNRLCIETAQVAPTATPADLSAAAGEVIAETCRRIRAARAAGRPVMLTFGAHTIKNGLGPVLIGLLRDGWLTHLATNGAGIIHDWEFSFQGQSGEEVRTGVDRGEFGLWEETGFYLNLAINVGAWAGRGYGEAVGALIADEGLVIPTAAELLAQLGRAAEDPDRAGAAAELLAVVREFALAPGFRPVPHPWQRFSVQAAAYRLGIPFTAHPMFGHDIIYVHPMNRGALLGRAAERDFLTFAASVSRLEDGVYLSLGSAVMSPMVFEKSLAMAQNLARQEGRHLERHFIVVADLAASRWDWGQGEPPPDNPEYYLRYNKTFSRMGGSMRYLQADSRDFLLALTHGLR